MARATSPVRGFGATNRRWRSNFRLDVGAIELAFEVKVR